MTKYIFVGDIHGKIEQVERALAMPGKKVFVGDFIDSWDRSVEDHKKCYDLVMDAIDEREAQAIFGNHELSYMYDKHRCSGYNSKRAYLMHMYQKSILDRFLPYLLLPNNILVSHAGLTKQLWDRHSLTLDNLSGLLETWWPDLKSPMHHIGRYRGGLDEQGGMFWCDWNQEFIPVPGLTQIFGHTAGKGIRQKDNNFCIDCLDHEHSFLELDL